MSLVLWPRDYERKPHISKYERALLQTASKNFTDGHFVVGIDPLGLCTQDNRMGLYISPKQGVVTFTVYTEPFNEALVDFGYIKTVSETEDKIYERLLESKALISNARPLGRLSPAPCVVTSTSTLVSADWSLPDELGVCFRVLGFFFFFWPRVQRFLGAESQDGVCMISGGSGVGVRPK